jgi:hypothetical protein
MLNRITLAVMICDMSLLNMLNLVVQYVMIYIMVLIWKLTNIPQFLLFGFAGYLIRTQNMMDVDDDDQCSMLKDLVMTIQ